MTAPRVLADRVTRNIRGELARAGITYAAVASHLGKSLDAVSRRMNGKQEWTLGEVELIADLVDVRVEEILLRE